MKNRFLKFAKEIVRIGGWISKHGNQSEIRDACDPEVKEFIRAKRNKNHLPCYDNTGTKFIDISKFKSWKGRAKVKHQWESHNKTKEELNKYENYKWDKDQLLYKLQQECPNNEWYEVPLRKYRRTTHLRKLENGELYSERKGYAYTYADYYEGNAIDELIKDDKLDVEYKEWEVLVYNWKDEMELLRKCKIPYLIKLKK